MTKKTVYGWVGSTVITHLQHLNLQINSVLLGLNMEEAIIWLNNHIVVLTEIITDRVQHVKTGFNSLARTTLQSCTVKWPLRSKVLPHLLLLKSSPDSTRIEANTKGLVSSHKRFISWKDESYLYSQGIVAKLEPFVDKTMLHNLSLGLKNFKLPPHRWQNHIGPDADIRTNRPGGGGGDS